MKAEFNLPLYSRYKDETGETTLNKLDFSDLDFSKPILVSLPGGGAFGGNDRSTSGMIKASEHVLGPEMAQDVQIASVKYPSLMRMAFNFIRHKYSPDTYSSPFARQLFNGLILPLLIDTNVPPSPDGRTLVRKNEGQDYDQMIRKLNKITLFAYSAGTWVSQGLCNIMNKTMKEIGYSDQEIKEAIGSVHLLSVGTVAKVVNSSPDRHEFTSVYVRGGNDVVARLLIGKPHREQISYDEAVKLINDGDNSVHIIKSICSRIAAWQKNQPIYRYPDEDIYKMVPSLPREFMARVLPLNHGLELFVTDTEKNILANMINRPETGSTIHAVLNNETRLRDFPVDQKVIRFGDRESFIPRPAELRA